MNIIANADKNWAIGKDGALLFPIDADLKNFKRLTLNKIVVMGRKTLESLPGSKPLKDRRNIVLSKTMPETEELHVCRSLASLQQLLSTQEFTNLTSDDVFVIGGAAVYAQLLPFCTTAYITKVEAEAQNPDAFSRILTRCPNGASPQFLSFFKIKCLTALLLTGGSRKTQPEHQAKRQQLKQ